MTVYLLTSRRVLHKGTRVGDSIQTFEACNLDQTKVTTHDLWPSAKRLCRRCFQEEER